MGEVRYDLIFHSWKSVDLLVWVIFHSFVFLNLSDSVESQWSYPGAQTVAYKWEGITTPRSSAFNAWRGGTQTQHHCSLFIVVLVFLFFLLKPCVFFCDQSTGDQTRTGHVLGEAHLRSEAPERQMTPAQCCVLRLLTHLAMLQGASKNREVRTGLFSDITVCKPHSYG